MEPTWDRPMPVLVFGPMAIAAMLAIFVLTVLGIRRKEASPIAAIGVFAGLVYVAVLFLAMAADYGLLEPLLASYPRHVREAITGGINGTTRVFWLAASCALAVVALLMIVAAFAMLPRLRSGRALRLAALVVRPGHRNVVEHWDQLGQSVRVRLWLGYLLTATILMCWGVGGIGLMLGPKANARLSFWGFWLSYLAIMIVNLQSWHYERMARTLERQSATDAADHAASA